MNKVIKKISSVLLSFVIVCTMMPAMALTVNAATDYNDIKVQINGEDVGTISGEWLAQNATEDQVFSFSGNKQPVVKYMKARGVSLEDALVEAGVIEESIDAELSGAKFELLQNGTNQLKFDLTAAHLVQATKVAELDENTADNVTVAPMAGKSVTPSILVGQSEKFGTYDEAAAADVALGTVSMGVGISAATDSNKYLQKDGKVTMGSTAYNGKFFINNYDTINIVVPEKKDPVLRIFGSNRYETGTKVADQLKKELGVTAFDNIIVACGSNYPDALAAGYLSKEKKAPVLLVEKSTEKTIKSYIDSNLKADGTVYIVGGTGVVSKEFENSLSGKKVRLAGSDRYGTNLAILGETGVKEDLVVCASNNYADALSASASGAPVLLVGDSITAAQQKFLKENAAGLKNVSIAGGTGAVNAKVENTLKSSYNVKRYAGKDRFETSAMIAEAFGGKTDEIVLVYGFNFPDGLTGSSIAWERGAQIVLVTNENSKYATDYVTSKGIKSCVVLGGTALISDAVVDAIMCID